MDKILISLLTLVITGMLVLFSCTKNKSTTCDDIQKSRFKCTANTPDNESMYTYLAKGLYEGQTVYFKNIMCPVCNVMPPQWGLTCKGDTVKFSNFSKVTDISQISICK